MELNQDLEMIEEELCSDLDNIDNEMFEDDEQESLEEEN